MALVLDVATCDEWHILKGETKYGPYTYADVIQMMQNKMVFEFDYIWAPHLESWTHIASVADFSPDRLNRVIEKSGEADVFNRRSSARVPVQLPVYVHDNARMWTGVVENLSEGGALVLMENPLLLPGHVIHLHYRNTSGKDAAFNCTAEILSKHMTKQRIQHDTGIHYAVKFLQITPVGDQQVKIWMKQNLRQTKTGETK